MTRFAIYASGKCTRIKRTLEKYPDIVSKIICVINDDEKDSTLLEYFDCLGIDYYSFGFKSLPKEKDRNLILSDYILKTLKDHKIDYCFSFGGHLLKGQLLDEYKYKLINFHPGIIPEVIGLHAIDKALEEKKRYIGNSVHFIDSGVDSGPIIMQNMILAENFKEYGYDLFLDAQMELIIKTMKLLEDNRIMVKDNKAIIIGADYTISHVFPEFTC